MSTNFPTSLDNSTTMPVVIDNITIVDDSHHNNQSDALIAIEGKIGIGASTPTSGKILISNGTGTSEWRTLTSGDIPSLVSVYQTVLTNSAGLLAALSDETGTGLAVFNNTPTLITPVLGVASVTSINKVTITSPATSATLTIADGKTLTASNTLTLTATDGSTLAIGTGGTLGTAAYTASTAYATSTQGTTADNAVPKSLYDANSVLYATSDNTPLALTVGASTIVGRKSTGDIVALTATETRTILNVADGATANTKASGSDITTGTDDAKFLTSKALADATVSKIGASWSSWTPSWTNLTVGSATVTALYQQVGKLVFCRLRIVWAADTSASGAVSFSLPVTASATIPASAVIPIGQCTLLDSGTAQFVGTVVLLSTTSAVYRTFVVSGSNIVQASTTSTAPFTWTTNDEANLEFFYEAV